MDTRSFIRVAVSLAIVFTVLAAILVALSQVPNARAERSRVATDYVVGGLCGATIQACIDNPIVLNGDGILIPAGTYTESLTLTKAVSLLGADAATTILHAVSNQRVITVTGSSITATTIISGLTFAKGNVAGDYTCPEHCGGGILVTETAQPLLQNLVIADNYADGSGGGLYADDHIQLTLVDVQVVRNTAGMGSGGGIFAKGLVSLIGGHFENNLAAFGLYSGGGGGLSAVTLTLTNTVFVSNAANYGGGVNASIATINDGLFQSNRSVGSSGGALSAGQVIVSGTQLISNTSASFGGGINAGSAWLFGARLENNHADGPGGGVLVYGDLLCGETDFINNSAESGGGIYAANWYGASTAFLTDTKFISNVAGSGGGIAIVSGPGDLPARIVNALLYHNAGAGIYIAGASATRPVYILHTTIADWSQNPGSAIAVDAGMVGITDTIITSHTIGISRGNGAVYADYNLFFGNNTNKVGTISGGSQDVHGDPRFVDAAADDYHLAPGSAAIDKGIFAGVLTDLDGHSRVNDYGGLRVDIGAYEAEYQGVIYHTYLPVTFKNQ